MKLIKPLIILLILYCSTQVADAQCNGQASLCNKTFNEVAFPYTHNSFNFLGPHFINAPNQNNSVSQQLNDGIRGLMLDIYEYQGEIVLLHGTSLFGIQPLLELLEENEDFLAANPNEVISIIFQSDITSSQLEMELISAGLMPYLHEQSLTDPWPTLQQMIAANKRLVVFSETDNGLASQTWHHYAWDYIFDTNYSHSSREDFSCDLNRGQSSNSLYLINHWVTTIAGVGLQDSAVQVNQYDVLYPRVEECVNQYGRIANFVGVDFYDHGNIFSVVDQLNNVSGTVSIDGQELPLKLLTANPAKGVVNLNKIKFIESCQLIDLNGQVLESWTAPQNLDLRNYKAGMYLIRFKLENLIQVEKLILQ